eukprot:scaffold156159_cov30-Tisochrysis_lutea.AAC.3
MAVDRISGTIPPPLPLSFNGCPRHLVRVRCRPFGAFYSWDPKGPSLCVTNVKSRRRRLALQLRREAISHLLSPAPCAAAATRRNCGYGGTANPIQLGCQQRSVA